MSTNDHHQEKDSKQVGAHEGEAHEDEHQPGEE